MEDKITTITEAAITDIETQSLKKIFGDSPLIEKVDSELTVKFELADGMAEGGQNVELKLSEMKIVQKNHRDEWVNAFEVKQLVVNGVDITDDMHTIFLEVRKDKGNPVSGTLSQKRVDERKTGHPINDHMLEVYGTSAVPSSRDSGNIFATTFKNADDLVNLFHEDGHLDDKYFYTNKFIQVRKENWLNNMFPDETKKKSPDELKIVVDTWKALITQEITADKNAIQKIIKLSEKVKLFTKDIENDLIRVRKSLEYIVGGYLNQMDGWYKKQLTPRELAELVGLL